MGVEKVSSASGRTLPTSSSHTERLSRRRSRVRGSNAPSFHLLDGVLLICLAVTTLSQSTVSVNPVSQIPDGQPQAPINATSVPVVETPFVSSTTTVPYENPFTSYLSMTNSVGVVTGMPSVVTSQPSAVTSQPISPTLPSYSGYAYSNSTTTSSSMSMSIVSASSSVAAKESTSGTASATFAHATGGADRVAGAGLALLVLGVGFSML